MRTASSPKRRIAAGLLSAVLLSVVGYQVVRRLNSHGPVALLKQAGDSSRRFSTGLTTPSLLSTKVEHHIISGAAELIAASTHVHASNRGSARTAFHDSVVDLALIPDPDRHSSTLSTKEIVSD